RTGKAEPGHGHWDGDIDPDLPYIDTVLKVTRMAAVLSKDGHTIPIGVAVDELHRLFQGVDAHDTQDRTENLFLVNTHIGLDIVKDGWPHKVAILVSRHLHTPAIKQKRGPLLYAGFNQGLNSLTGTRRHQRSQIGLAVCAHIHLHGCCALDQFINPLTGFSHHHGNGNCHATLTSRAESSTQELVNGDITICVRHHDAMVL